MIKYSELQIFSAYLIKVRLRITSEHFTPPPFL